MSLYGRNSIWNTNIHGMQEIIDSIKPFDSFPEREKGEWNYKNVEEWANEHNIVLVSDEWYEKAHSALSADREKGEWIKIQSGDDKFPESIVCSKCKNENSHLDFDEHGEPIGKVFITSKFCPKCGADMRGKAE